MSGRLDSRSLALFRAVADAMSFRQAAQALHLSQPPLSRAIRELEQRLGVRLFERQPKGVALTEAGRRLAPYARKVARLLSEAEAAVTTRSMPGTLRVGLTSAVEPGWFRGLAERVEAAHRGTKVTTASDSSPRLVRHLLAGRLDAAFVALPTEVPGLSVVEVDRQAMKVALPSAHPLARRKAIWLADLARQPVFWFERARQPGFYDHCQRIFARHGFEPRVIKEPADHHVLLAEVAAGKGIAFVPQSLTALRRSGVSYRALLEGDDLAVAVGLATRSDHGALRDVLLRAAVSDRR